MRFGTDGIRGIFNVSLDTRLAEKAGYAVAHVFEGDSVLLSRDTRESGAELEEAVARGLIGAGKQVIVTGIIPTPAAAYLTAKLRMSAGIMITASHNPPEYNGIKIFNGNGLKATLQQELAVDRLIDKAPAPSRSKGKIMRLDAAEQYINHIAAAVGDLSGIRIIADCGFGATCGVTKEIFQQAGAKITVINDAPDGSRINLGCGALYPENVQRSMTDFDLGVSFDGDGDRISVIDKAGVLDGDSVLYNLSTLTGAKTVVGTVLTNSALEHQLQAEKKQLLRTPVGDKYIARLMVEENHLLGGEQSGHFIVRPYAYTGDALLVAAILAQQVCRGKSFKRLQLIPQKDIACPAVPSVLYRKEVQELKKQAERALGESGRILLRMSGTEPKVRVMIESADAQLVDTLLDRFAELFG